MPDNTEFVSVKERLPEEPSYYRVRFADGTEDEKPFRARRSVRGFMTEKDVTHWREIRESEMTGAQYHKELID